MNPVITLVGRPNVGKSTLFNHLTRTRDALVADFPGLTRDRKYGIGQVGQRDYIIVDTGGLIDSRDSIDTTMAEQTRFALTEADAIVLLVDGREGLTAADETIAQELRTYNKPTFLAVNKVDGLDPDQACAEFYGLGFANLHPIAAAHGRGVAALAQDILETLPGVTRATENQSISTGGIRIAFIGRPNVGKSTLINRLVGTDRLLTYDRPGTTRDSVEVPFAKDGQDYVLIDTAGVRRRSRVKDVIEKFSVIKSLQAINAAHVVIMVLDARQGIADQDASLLGLVMETGRAVVLAVNKWDGLTQEHKSRVKQVLDLKLPFLDFAERHMISALHGTGLGNLMRAVHKAFGSAMIKVSTAELTRLLEIAVRTHQPPLVRGRRIKLRYAHQGGSNPMCIVIHGNQTRHIPGDYRRYLVNTFRQHLGLTGAQIRLEFKTGENPYSHLRNTLTPRQVRKRKRLRRFVKHRV